MGKGYVHDESTGDGESTATFRFTAPAAGDYELRMAYSAHPTRATKVPVQVTWGDHTTNFAVDQTQSLPEGEHFRAIGKVALPAERECTITVGNGGTNGFVIVDALQLVAVTK